MSGARGIIYSMSEAFYDSQRHHFQEHSFYYQQYKEATLTTAMVPFTAKQNFLQQPLEETLSAGDRCTI